MAKYEASGVLIGQVHPTMTKHLPGVLNNVPGSLPPKGGGRRGRKKGKEEGEGRRGRKKGEVKQSWHVSYS